MERGAGLHPRALPRKDEAILSMHPGTYSDCYMQQAEAAANRACQGSVVLGARVGSKLQQVGCVLSIAYHVLFSSPYKKRIKSDSHTSSKAISSHYPFVLNHRS